jgi:hypothetical protein
MQINLADLFFEAFGYKTDAFEEALTANPVDGDKKGSRVETGQHGSPYYVFDSLGREYFLPIKVVVGNDIIPGTSSTYAEALGATDASGNPVDYWYLPYPVLSADVNKHIIDTELTERNGMVSELINIGGYKINVKGFIINQIGNDYPENDMNILNRLFNINKAVEIYNPVTDVLLMNANSGSRTVTLRSLKFPERPGVKHVRAYELEMWSNVPFNLIDIAG